MLDEIQSDGAERSILQREDAHGQFQAQVDGQDFQRPTINAVTQKRIWDCCEIFAGLKQCQAQMHRHRDYTELRITEAVVAKHLGKVRLDDIFRLAEYPRSVC